MGDRWKLLFLFVMLVFVYLSPAGPVAARKFSDWSPPVLVLNVNSEFNDVGPAISKDQRSLYFTSNRPAGGLDTDIWVSRRARVEDSWGTPINLGPTINTTAVEAIPAFSRDGHWMFFHSNRPAGSGALDLWASWRRRTNDDFGWTTPVNLGPAINSSFGDAGASYLAIREQNDDDDPDAIDNDDENENGVALLFFGSNRPPEISPNFDLYVSAQNPGGSFGPPTSLSELNSSCSDQRPSIRSDGLEIFFHSNGPAPGGAGCATVFDLWVAKRDTLSQVWYAPENLGPVVNGASNDQHAFISSDSLTLYFASNRPGGPGMFDLYVTTRDKGKSGGDD
jgi:hypothetical protein